MSSHEVHEAGISLEDIVAHLRAELKGPGARNSADYYDYSKGIYDGVASALEAIAGADDVHRRLPQADGTQGARYRVGLEDAIEALRKIDPSLEDPDQAPLTVTALVSLLLALHALHEHMLAEASSNETSTPS